MADCIYCGQKAGIFQKRHKECEDKYKNGKKQIIATLTDNILSGIISENLLDEIYNMSKNSFTSENELKEITILGWERAVDQSLEDDFLSQDEENNLRNAIDKLNINENEIKKHISYTRLIQGSILRKILEGQIPETQIQKPLPFNFQKKEKIIWVYKDVSYYETKTRIKYVGGHQSVSIRVAKGIYYRTGSFKGEPIPTQETIHVDNGILVITDKHLYFGGNLKSFRLKYEKIISFTPYSDGIGLQKDGARANPQIFVTGDGWFIYNAIINLARL